MDSSFWSVIWNKRPRWKFSVGRREVSLISLKYLAAQFINKCHIHLDLSKCIKLCRLPCLQSGQRLLLASSAGRLPCRVSHSHSPLIKLQPCSLLSCLQTKVLKRTPSVIASNLRHNVLFHVSWSQRKGSCCSFALSHFHFCRSCWDTNCKTLLYFEKWRLD